jgi:hypothetical protein
MEPPYGSQPRQSLFGGLTGAYDGITARIGDNSGMIVAMIALSLVVFIILAYVVYRYLITTLKTTTLVDKPLHARNNSKAVDSDKIPSLDNGLEYAMSFWVYVDSVSTSDKYKKVLTLGTTDACSFMCVMDKGTNRMYMGFKLSNCAEAQRKIDAVESAFDAYALARTNNGNPNAGKSPNEVLGQMIVPIEYVPLQRWVNITFVVNQDIITLYLDGDIYSVSSVDSFVSADNAGRPISATVSPPMGSLIVGSSIDGINGFVSRVQFFNYAISVYHARMLYASGPINRGILGYVGMPRYRLQWPVTSAYDGTTDSA